MRTIRLDVQIPADTMGRFQGVMRPSVSLDEHVAEALEDYYRYWSGYEGPPERNRNAKVPAKNTRR